MNARCGVNHEWATFQPEWDSQGKRGEIVASCDTTLGFAELKAQNQACIRLSTASHFADELGCVSLCR